MSSPLRLEDSPKPAPCIGLYRPRRSVLCLDDNGHPSRMAHDEVRLATGAVPEDPSLLCTDRRPPAVCQCAVKGGFESAEHYAVMRTLVAAQPAQDLPVAANKVTWLPLAL